MGGQRRDRLAALFDAHEERLYGLARRLTASAPDGDAARDLVQETFLRAAKAWQSVPEGGKHEEAWLVRVLVNLQRDEWRKKAVRTRTADALQADQARTSPDAEGALIAKQAVWAALDTLPPRRRAMVIMFELEGKTPVEIAETLGVSRVTVRWHLSMGRRDLKRALSTYLERP